MLRVAVVLMALFTASKAFSQTQMQFTAFPPDRSTNALMGAHAWRIYASGLIDEDADKRLEEVIQRNNIPQHSDIFLHSGGGSLAGGMKLGKVIRKYLLHSNVGQLDLSSKDQGSPKAGNCYSACAIAYLGGEYRFLMTGSVYGIHRFYLDKQTKQDVDLAQMMSRGRRRRRQSGGPFPAIIKIRTTGDPVSGCPLPGGVSVKRHLLHVADCSRS
jgi:hypothetical protein